MWRTILIFVLSLSSFAYCDESESKIVNLKQGPVRGYKDHDSDIYSFYGIPYATAPTGRDKFKAPLPPPVWTETLDAVDKGVVCPQVGVQNFPPLANLTTHEDCLIANIYVPDTNEQKLPVVVYVHGGAFVLGYGNFVTYKNLMKSKKFIVITFNYRLGAHGFLCLGTESIPGNAGMKDQVALLKWVQNNIDKFGGNPNDVTIAGFSAGSASVDLLMVSKSAEGLFNKVIPESGANLAAFAIQTDPLQNAKEYAGLINLKNVDDIEALEEFYRTIPHEVLYSADVMERSDSVFLMSPCVEPKTNEQPFLTESPYDILKSGSYKKLPMLYGFANMEGLLRLPLFEKQKEQMNKDFSAFLPPDLQFSSEEERQAVAQKVKEFYFGTGLVTEEHILDYINFFSDVIFVYPTLRSVNLNVEAGHKKIYLYEYSFTHAGDPVIPHANVRGATHCAQTIALMDGADFFRSEDDITDDYREMKDIIRKIWINFILTGEPIPKDSSLPAWPPVEKDCSPHMELKLPLELKGSLANERSLFWDEIYSKHFRKPTPPPVSSIRTEL